MGVFRSVFEHSRPSAPEYLGRLEDDWKNEVIAQNPRELIIDPDAVFADSLTLEGPSSQRWRIRPLLTLQNGKSLEEFSAQETQALTEALELRFNAHLILYKKARDYPLDVKDEDFAFQQRFIEEQGKILRGYVNLIAAINHETSAKSDPDKAERVIAFLDEYKFDLVDIFAEDGGVSALLARTKHVDQSHPVMQRLMSAIDAKVFSGLEFAAAPVPDVSGPQR